MMKNAFCFMLKAFFSLKIFTCLSSLFGYVEKRLNKKAKVNFKIYHVTAWTANNCNAHIASKAIGNQVFKFGQLIKCNVRNIFPKNSCGK